MQVHPLTTLILAVGAAILVTSCSSGGDSSIPAAASISLTAVPTTITTGGSSALTGVFTSGTGVITPGNLAATSGTAVTVTPTETTVYTLTDTPTTGTALTATATVTVVPAPFITTFTAAASSVAAGTATTLTPVFGDGTGVITPGNISATSGTAVSTGNLGSSTTFTLTVTNAAGTKVTQQTSVSVTNTAPAVITSFTALPTTITAGASAGLTGVFSNGTGVITPGNLPANSGSAVTVTPSATTVYTLTDTPSTGSPVTATATVTVVAAPTITSFTPTSSSIASGTATTLTAVFGDGTGVITPGNISVTSGTAVSTGNLTADTTFTLTVTNAAGTTATKTAVVDVTSTLPPSITSFVAAPSTVTAGGSSKLTGVFANGSGVVTPGNISVTSGTAVSVSPAATTTYTLTVTNAASATTTATAQVTVTPALSQDQASWESFNTAPNASYETFMYLPYTRQTLSSATDYWVYNTVQLPASPSLGAVSVTASALGDMFNPSVLPIPPVSDLVPNRYLIGGTIYYASEPTYIRKLSYPSGALEGITGGVRSDVYDATGSVIVESYINSGYSVNTLTGVMASTPAELANTMSPIFFNTGLFGAGLAATDWAAGSAYEKFTSTVIGNTYFIFDYSTTQVKQNPPTPVATNKTLAQVLAAGVNSSNDSVVYNLSNGAITATPVAGSVASYMASIPRPNKTFTTYVMLYQLADGNVYMGEVMKDGAVTGGNSYMTATGLNYSQNYEIRLNEAAVSSLSLALATK